MSETINVAEWRKNMEKPPWVLYFRDDFPDAKREYISEYNLSHLSRSEDIDFAIVFDNKKDVLKHFLNCYSSFTVPSRFFMVQLDLARNDVDVRSMKSVVEYLIAQARDGEIAI